MEDRRVYTCTLCSFTTRAKLQMLHHIRSMRHLQMEQLHQIQRHAEGKAGTQQDIGDIFKVEEAEEEGRHTPPGEFTHLIMLRVVGGVTTCCHLKIFFMSVKIFFVSIKKRFIFFCIIFRCIKNANYITNASI